MKNVLLHRAEKTTVTATLRLACLALPLMAGATGALAGQRVENWQINRLFHPTATQLVREQQGSVFIYGGLTDRDIERAMDQAFDRIGSMMFINVVATDDSGTPTSPTTDVETNDDDGC